MDTKFNWEEYFSGDLLEEVVNTPEEVQVAKTPEKVQVAKKESYAPWVNPALIKRDETEKKMNLKQSYVPPNYDIKALNIIEFFSVIIQSDKEKDLNDFEMYGHIKLTNDYGKEFFLFEREHHHPETASMVDNRRAILPKPQGYQPRWVPVYFRLELYLVDKTRNVTIVDEECLLDFRGKVVYDEEQSVVVYDSKGGYGSVTLNYVVFRCALFGITTIEVFKKNTSGIENDETDEEVVSVSGSISASTKVEGMRELTRVLCDVSMSLSVNNDKIPLPMFAVPAYSSLRIKPDLVVNGERIVTGDDGTLEYKPEADHFACFKRFMGENWGIYLGVSFSHPYSCLDEDELIGELISYDTYKILYENDYGSSGSDDESLLVPRNSTIDESQLKRFWPKEYARQLVEVFSIYVGSFSHERTLSVFGTIKYETISFENEFKSSVLFEREEVKPEVVYPYKPISLLKPCNCYEADNGYFAMHLDLKDAGGREISSGCMKWSFPSTFSWYDKRICSVVTGEHGFACVHYAIFQDAVCARVRARLLSLDFAAFEVYGSIYARYRDYRCSTSYEKKFYRSMLLKREKSESMELCGLRSFDIPLSKDVVAVQPYTKLILDVKLHVLIGGKLEETIKGELQFNPEGSTMICAKKIEGQKLLVVLEVEWS